jgi:hypothetical protein
MVEDKYIGLALAVSSSLAIGTSFIITKKVGHLELVACVSPKLSGLGRRDLLMQEHEILRMHLPQKITLTFEIQYGGLEFRLVSSSQLGRNITLSQLSYSGPWGR